MDCREALPHIHAYLDGDLSTDEVERLQRHLRQCSSCRTVIAQLEKTEALLRTERVSDQGNYIEAPAGLKDRIMQALPANEGEYLESKRNTSLRRAAWFRRYPGVTAAALFAAIMLGSLATTLSGGGGGTHELVVRGTDLQAVRIHGDTVIVPAGTTVAGNLTVENGKLEVAGDVKGNVTVIDGTFYSASTAHISGQVTKANQLLDRIWVRIQGWVQHESGS